MFSSLFENRPRRKPRRADRSPFASSYGRTATPPPRQLFNQRKSLRYQDEEESQSRSSGSDQDNETAGSSREGHSDEDAEREEDEEAAPLLPLFDHAHLDTIPTYVLTHTIRLMVISRCETVLTWDQLRSPQVSQFLLKPIQQEIQANHFSAATIYCLMANCLQFTKEIAMYPANSGNSQTRSMICELLAIKLLREYSTRGLIDALSYDFDPLQGQADAVTAVEAHRPSWQSGKKNQPRSARISCLEIAIRAQAKRFLSHPVVVQQLEAIWDGSIVFHAAADNIHRSRGRAPIIAYGTNNESSNQQIAKVGKSHAHTVTRKVVTLYNPRDASLFKLSRLRVPRYRNFLSTLSFAILLVIYIAVLVQRSLYITSLEVLFWFWAAGFMMDEIVGVSEQGFSLYIASFWNAMDLGILLILVAHLCLRIYGIVMPDTRKHDIATMAFDLLAADAILLFPRLFSVLDHYKYFSQLIIAFRLMTADLAAVSVLIVIICSGFFVSLTLAFRSVEMDDAYQIAYALLQMVLGFTPAVWDRWDTYPPLGRLILVSFLGLCHFMILTILITVLTNSFMAVVKNANEEHQFIFAVNTIQSVKSDALFSYVPPLNVLQWLLNPLRYTIPLRQYVKINRTVIKITHLPILFMIYLYEKAMLQSTVVDSIDLMEHRQKAKSTIAQRLPRLGHEPSIANFRQDQALEEVFKQPFDATVRTEANSRRKSSTVVNQWMREMGEDSASSPEEDDPGTVDKLERRRLGERSLSAFSRVRRSSRPLSVASDPADLASHNFFSPQPRIASMISETASQIDAQDTADGDDELQTIDNDEDRMTTETQSRIGSVRPQTRVDYFAHRSSPMRTPVQPKSVASGSRGRHSSNLGRGLASGVAMPRRPIHHMRTISSATMIYNPPQDALDEEEEAARPPTAIQTAAQSRPMTPGSRRTSSGGGKRTPKLKQPSRLRPTIPGKDNPAFRSAPDINSLSRSIPNQTQRRSSLEMDLVSDIGDNKAIGGGYVGAIPASFATQMAFATGGLQKLQQERKEEQQMFGRLMMARMNTLEEGFREVIHEMRENIISGSTNRSRDRSKHKSNSPNRPAQARRERRAAANNGKGKGKEKESDNTGSNTPIDPKQSELTVIQAELPTAFTEDPKDVENGREPVVRTNGEQEATKEG